MKHGSVLIFLVVVLCLSVGYSYGQELFERGITTHKDGFVSDIAADLMAPLPDGGAIVAGTLTDNPSGILSGIIARISEDGKIVWIRRMMAGSQSVISGLSVDASGNIIFSGMVYVPTSNLFVSKLSPDGDLIWSKIYKYTGYEELQFQRMLSDGSILAGGRTHGNAGIIEGLLIKWDPNGNILWDKHPVINRPDSARITFFDALELPDQTILTASAMSVRPSTEVLGLTEFSSNGQLGVSHAYADSGMGLSPHTMLLRGDGSILIAGKIETPNSIFRPIAAFVLSLDPSLTLQWNEQINFFSQTEYISQIKELDKGELALFSSFDQTLFFNNSAPAHITLLSAAGEINLVLGIAANPYRFSSLKIGPQYNGRYLGTGIYFKDNTDGDTLHSGIGTLSLTSDFQGCAVESGLTAGSTVTIVTGTMPSITYGSEQHTVVTMPFSLDTQLPYSTFTICHNLPQNAVEEKPAPVSAVAYPNPVTTQQPLQLHIPLSLSESCIVLLRDLTGNIRYRSREELHAGTDLIIPTADLTSGIYFVELADVNSFTTLWRGKVVIE